MRIAVFDPFSGIAGDMTVAALLDAGASEERVREGLATLGVAGYRVEVRRDRDRGFVATRFLVRLDEREEHPHRGLSDVLAILRGGVLPPRALARATAVFEALAHAEAAVHGTTPEKVHFHEVGAVDAIVDVAAACLALEDLGVEEVWTRPVWTGGGTIEGAHGAMPVPAPATARLLADARIPTVLGGEEIELATPTGAAILAALAEPGAPRFEMRPTAIGHGAGTRPGERLPNLLRVFLAEREASAEATTTWQIEVNLDDVSPEILGPLPERLREAGAHDAYWVAAQMKKGRPGVLLTALVTDACLAAVENAIFEETTTFGLRRFPVVREVLARRHVEVETPWGPVRIKEGLRGDRVVTASPEHEDCARRAREAGVPVRRVDAEARRSYGA